MNDAIIWGSGWSHYEVIRSTKEYFVWSSGENWIHVLNPNVTQIELIFEKHPLSPAKELIVTSKSGRTIIIPIINGQNTIKFELNGKNDIKINVETFVVPNDNRSLGICIKALNYWIHNEKKSPRLDDIRMRMPFPIESRSIFEQSNGNTQLIQLPANNSTIYFNSSIFEKNENIYLLTTKNDNPIYPKYKRHWDATLNLVQLNSNFDPTQYLDMNIPCDVSIEQFFDPRVLIYKDSIILSVNAINKTGPEKCGIKLIWLDKNFKFEKMIIPKYEIEKEHKNWTWFNIGESLFAIIRFNPYTIVEFDIDGNPIKEFKHKNVTWKYGEIRGGANPILLNGVYHSFFHSHLLKNWDGIRVYFMGHLTFEAIPPFRISTVSEFPILSGNTKDKERDIFLKDKVVFPLGVIWRDNTFYISLGLNDNETHLLKYKI